MPDVEVELRNVEDGDALDTKTTDAGGRYALRKSDVQSPSLWVVYLPRKCDVPGPDKHIKTARQHACSTTDPDARKLPDVYLSACATPKDATAAGRLLANGLMFDLFRGETDPIELLRTGIAAWRTQSPGVGGQVEDLLPVADQARSALQEFGVTKDDLPRLRASLSKEGIADAFVAAWLQRPEDGGQLAFGAMLSRVAQYEPSTLPQAWQREEVVHFELARLAGPSSAKGEFLVSAAPAEGRPGWSGFLPALRLPDGSLDREAAPAIHKMIQEHRELLPWSVYQRLVAHAKTSDDKARALSLLEARRVRTPKVEPRKDDASGESPTREPLNEPEIVTAIATRTLLGKVRIALQMLPVQLSPGESLTLQVARDEGFREVLVQSERLNGDTSRIETDVALPAVSAIVFVRLVVRDPTGAITRRGKVRQMSVQ